MKGNQLANLVDNRLASYCIIVCLLVAAYFTALGGDFISDDRPMIAENAHLSSLEHVPDYFVAGVWANSNLEMQKATLYRPVYLLWYFAVYHLAGPQPLYYHIALLLLHAVNALLLYSLLVYLAPRLRFPVPLLLTTLFALHPVLTQAVGWISGGTDVLMSLFLLLSFLGYLRFQQGNSAYLLAASLVSYTAALFVKETAVVFPLMIAAYELTRGRTLNNLIRSRAVLYLLPFAGYLVIRTAVIDTSGFAFSPAYLWRMAEQIFLSFRYSFFPWPLPFYFKYPAGGASSQLDIVLGLVGALSFFVIYARFREARFGLAWFLLFLFPSLAISFHLNGVFALRFLYLPLMGIVLALAGVAGKIDVRPQRVFAGTLLIISVLFFTGTVIGNKTWQSEREFFLQVIDSEPYSQSGYKGLADYYKRNGELGKAIAVYRKGIHFINNTQRSFDLSKELALIYSSMRMYDKSLALYNELVEKGVADAGILINIGNCHLMLKNYDKALENYEKAVHLYPKNSLALANYAGLLVNLGQEEKARTYYQKIMQLPRDTVQEVPLQRAQRFLNSSK